MEERRLGFWHRIRQILGIIPYPTREEVRSRHEAIAIEMMAWIKRGQPYHDNPEFEAMAFKKFLEEIARTANELATEKALEHAGVADETTRTKLRETTGWFHKRWTKELLPALKEGTEEELGAVVEKYEPAKKLMEMVEKHLGQKDAPHFIRAYFLNVLRIASIMEKEWPRVSKKLKGKDFYY